MAENVTLETIRKPQIIDATLKKISEVGFYNVTMDDVAREAGLSKGGIAHYFPSKESLFKEAFRVFNERIFQRGKEVMDQKNNPLDKLLSFTWLYNRDDPDYDIGYPLHFDCMALAARDGEYREIFHEWVNNWIALLSEALEEGVSSGEYAITDIEGTARTISAVYHGIALRWFLDSESHSTEWAVESLNGAITHLMSDYINLN
jgi:AcrR family transcriptional regulator